MNTGRQGEWSFTSSSARMPFGLLLCLMLCASVLPAGEATVRLAADEAWQPFIDPDSPGGGLITDLAVNAFREAGREAEVSFLPWSRALAATAGGEYDALAGAYHSEERAEHFLYSDAFLLFNVSLIVRRDFPLEKYNDFSELADYRIGVIRDAAYPDAFLEAGLDLHESGSRTSLVRMLREGRIDMLADTRELFRQHALEAEINPDAFRPLRPSLREKDLFLIAPRDAENAQTLIDDFNRGLEKLKEDDQYLEIRRRHGY